jgi:DNA polymerase (family 10)
MTAGGSSRHGRLRSNTALADLFQRLADYLAMDGQSSYRIIAYEKAVALFRVHPVSVAEMALRGDLRNLPGIGQAIESKVIEYVTTGRLPQLEKLSERYPDGLLTLMHLPGVGPKTARKLWEQAHIADVHMLKQACIEGRVRGLPGMGQKTEQNFLRAIESWEARAVETPRARRLLAEVEPQAAYFVGFLRALPMTTAADYAGSLRRRRSLVRDIDLVVGSGEPASIMDAFAELPELANIEERGETKLGAITHTGLGLDLRVVEPASYGNLLQHFTGSAAHNVALRGYAQRRGLKINEYNIEHVDTGGLTTCATEAEVYHILGLAYIEPELRENHGEIAAAAAGALPNLVELSDIRGDLHVHSDWSDGRATMEEMALGAKQAGLEYICFCDHSHSLAARGGISADRLMTQIEAIRRLDATIDGIRILTGSEVDILIDGRLDWPDEILQRLDFVTASIHSGFSQPRDQIMGRLAGAMRNPYVRSIGHPTGRLLTRRDPYDVDFDQLAAVAVETGTFLEINASCDRLDLSAPAIRRVVELGATLVVCSDAHHPDDFGNLKFAIWEARRGWLEPGRVANTRSWTNSQVAGTLAGPKLPAG